MTPFEWGMLILSAIGTGNALLSSEDILEETPGPVPGGGQGQDNLQALLQASQPTQTPGAPDVPTLTGPVAAATKAAQAVPKTKVTTPPELKGPSGRGGGTPKGTEEGPGVGQVLAAVPEALAAVAPLLGLTETRQFSQRPAPVAGGQPGRLVGQFAQTFGPQNLDIGRLLAQLPGIRG